MQGIGRSLGPSILLGLLLLVAATPATSRPVAGQLSKPVAARIDSTLQVMYGPGTSFSGVFWYGPFPSRDATSIDAMQIADAMDDLDWLEYEVDPVWFGSSGPGDGTTTARSLQLRTQRATFMNAKTGDRGVVATVQPLGMDQAGAYMVLVRRPAGRPTLVPGRDGYVAQDTYVAPEVRAPVAAPTPSAPVREAPRAQPARATPAPSEPGFHLGPILGAMFLSAGENTFFSPMYGASVRRDPYSLFLGDSGAFSGDEDGADRFRFGGFRYGQATGPFGQLIAIDARRILPDRDVYTHRATGATGGAGYQWATGHLHGSITGGVGAFDAIAPGEADSKIVFGFNVAGHAGFTF